MDENLKKIFEKGVSLIDDYDLKKEFNNRQINFGNIILRKNMELNNLNTRKDKIQNEINIIDEQNSMIKEKIKNILENV